MEHRVGLEEQVTALIRETVMYSCDGHIVGIVGSACCKKRLSVSR